jgi:hypothetical protein
MNLGEVVEQLASFDEDAEIWIRDGEWQQTSPATVRAAAMPRLPRPWRYLLEVYLAAEAIEVWRDWRRGQEPTLDEKVRAVVFYGVNDAYEPTERELEGANWAREFRENKSTDRRYQIKYIRPRMPPSEDG